MASFLGGIWDAISGSGQIKSAAKAGKKAAKVQQATSKEQLQRSTDLYNQQRADAAAALPQQQGYLTSANAQAQNALGADLQRQQALYQGQVGTLDPYLQYGQQGMNALGGYYGTDPAQSQAMIQAFQNSPLYQTNYQNSLDTAVQGLERNMGANRLLNSGRTLKGLQDRAGAITNQLFGQYVNQANNAINTGAGAAGQRGQLTGQFSNALGNNAQLSASAYNNLGQNQAGALGSYVTNLGQYGNLLSNNQQAGYGNLLAGQGAQGSASAAGHLGLANTAQGFWSGLGSLGGNALGYGMQTGFNGAPNWQNALSSIPGNYQRTVG